MSKRPVAVWIAASILSLYTIGFLAMSIFQALRFYAIAQALDGPIFITTRMVVGLVFGLLGLFTAVALVKGKRWSRWIYLLQIMVIPILMVSDTYSGFNDDEFMDPGDHLGFWAVVLFFNSPLFAGVALVTLGNKVNAFFADTSAEVSSGIAEPPPPPTF